MEINAPVLFDEEPKKEPEAPATDEGKTCSSTHKCNNASVTGQCILKDGHEGSHFCGWCASQF